MSWCLAWTVKKVVLLPKKSRLCLMIAGSGTMRKTLLRQN